VAVVDKAALLCMLAGQSDAAGATLRYGQAVTGLIEEKGRIVGVRPRGGEVRAAIVLSAEGVGRTFTQAAGLYVAEPPLEGYAIVVSQELEAPAAGPADVGQLCTLGQRYGALPRSFGTVVVPAPGRAGVYLALFTAGPQVHTDESLWDLLERYKKEDPRVRNLLAGSRVLHRAGCHMVLRRVPRRVVRDGFAGVGDSVGPGGHVGILPAFYLGQEAARAAAAALQAGNTSAQGLAAYDRLLHGPLLRGLETEGKIMTGLAAMSDGEIDRVCQTLGRMNLAPFFFGAWGPIVRESARWVLTSLPQIARDWRLLRRML
jgi:flavin-dependent dehydrogenase